MKLVHLTLAALVAASPAVADDMPGYAFVKPTTAPSVDPSSDAMTEALRAQIRSKYGDQIEAGDLIALRALAAADESAPLGAKTEGPIRFSSDRFTRPEPAAAPSAKSAPQDAAAIVAGMSPAQIRAVMAMAQAMAEADAPAAPATSSKPRTVSVGTGQNMLIEDWIAGVDASGTYYIENTRIPGSRVPLRTGSVVGALGKVRDMRVSGGQTQVTFASGDMIVGDAPDAGSVPGDNLSGEIIVSGAAPAPIARMSTKSTPASPDQAAGAKNSASAVSDAAATDPQTSTKAKTMSDSKLAPTRSRRPLHKPPHEGEPGRATSQKSSQD